MALGGGTWLTQNKILPGAYINFVQAARASATLSDRGVATVPVIFDWGVQGEMTEVTARDFQRNSKRLFGYDFTHPNLKGLRDLFRNIRLAYIYRLGSGGTRASNTLATARFPGTRGNDITITVAGNVDEPASRDFTTLLDGAVVDMQTVADAGDLVANDFVTWNVSDTITATAGMPLTGGTSPTIRNSDYQAYLDAAEGYNFNAICCPSGDSGVKGLFAAFTKRMREEQGVKFQCVVHNFAADHEGIINVMNNVKEGKEEGKEYGLVWWTTGVAAGTPVNRSATNRLYDTGEFAVDVNFTQPEFKRAVQNGKFAFYRGNNGEVRVLRDINSLVNLTPEKGEDFRQNQTIRVADQTANDMAVLFNTRYLGIMPNDRDGRLSLWSDIVQHHRQLETIRAIENFEPEDVTVEQGETKRAVSVTTGITPVNAMEKLYMTVYIN